MLTESRPGVARSDFSQFRMAGLAALPAFFLWAAVDLVEDTLLVEEKTRVCRNTLPARGHALVSHLKLIWMPELLAVDAVPTWFSLPPRASHPRVCFPSISSDTKTHAKTLEATAGYTPSRLLLPPSSPFPFSCQRSQHENGGHFVAGEPPQGTASYHLHR